MKVDLDFEVRTPAPPTADFYGEWLPKVRGMAVNLRLRDADEVAQDVIVDFITSGYLDRWDSTAGRSFESFCFWMLRNRLYSKLRTQKRRLAHELPVSSVLAEPEHGEDFYTSWLDAEGAYEDPRFEITDQLTDLSALATHFMGREGNVFEALVAFAEDGSEMHDRRLAEELGCSATTVRTHRLRLRDEIERGAGDYFSVT